MNSVVCITSAGILWGIIAIFISLLKDLGFNSLQCVAIRVFFSALCLVIYLSIFDRIDVLPIAKARGFWDTDEPCYQKTVLRVLSTMDNALPIFIYYLREKKILSPSFFIFIAAFKSLS